MGTPLPDTRTLGRGTWYGVGTPHSSGACSQNILPFFNCHMWVWDQSFPYIHPSSQSQHGFFFMCLVTDRGRLRGLHFPTSPSWPEALICWFSLIVGNQQRKSLLECFENVWVQYSLPLENINHAYEYYRRVWLKIAVLQYHGNYAQMEYLPCYTLLP